MFHSPIYPALLLAVESGNVIDMRLRKVARSSPAEAHAEVSLMVTEKMAAAIKASVILMTGGTTAAVFSHYRDEVAANAVRLSASK